MASFLDNIPSVTKNLIMINILVFVATCINENLMVANFAMFYPASSFFRIWQIVTHMFMHGGFAHIFFNMYSLLMFGAVLENAIGSRKFLIYYFACGLGAALLHTGVEAVQAAVYASSGNYASLQMLYFTPSLGASGAVYGLFIGYAMMYPHSKLTLIFPPVTMSARTMVIVFAAIELLTGVTGTMNGVAHFAHLGGMLIGWIIIRWWMKKGKIYRRW